MQNLKRKISKIYQNLTNKRHLRADVLSLLSSALRPRLLDNRGSFITNGVKIVTLSIILGSFSFITILFGAPVSAASLTLTLPSDPLTLNFDSSSNETFKESSSATVSAKTSGINYGYTLSIKAKDGNTLKNDKNNTLNSISSSLSASNFANQSQSNIWGYQPSKFNSSSNSNYLAGPTTTSSTIDKTNSSSNSTTSYSFKIAAKIDSVSAVGKYSNTFILTLTANSVSYKITYYLNSGSWTETSPQSGDTIESSVKISSVAPTRSGYTFEGWCSKSVTNNSGTNPTCSGTKYSASGTYTLTSGTNNLSLYAMWKSASRSYTINYRSNISGASNMPSTQSGSVSSPYSVNLSSNTPTLSGYDFQGWCSSSTSTTSCSGTKYQPSGSVTITSSGQTINLYAMWEAAPTMQGYSCSSLSQGSTVILRDTRDGNTYTIAKLRDGKCWMTENLRIVGKTISSSDSDMTSGSFTIPASNRSKFIVDSTVVNTATGRNNDAAYKKTVSYTDSVSGAKSFESGYYTWHTATAGTGTADHTTQGWNAPSSICPKGWKLPTGGTSGDFRTLIGQYNIGNNAVGSNTLRGAPFNFTYAGYIFYDGSERDQGSVGYYWSSTLNIQTVYQMSFSSSYVYSSGSSNHAYGIPVRCVAQT